MRASGFSRCTRRIFWRTSSSAVAVTVHVLSTTMSACVESEASSPLAARAVSSAAPSACEARHPKLWTWKRCTVSILSAALLLSEKAVYVEVECGAFVRARLDSNQTIVIVAVFAEQRLRLDAKSVDAEDYILFPD